MYHSPRNATVRRLPLVAFNDYKTVSRAAASCGCEWEMSASRELSFTERGMRFSATRSVHWTKTVDQGNRGRRPEHFIFVFERRVKWGAGRLTLEGSGPRWTMAC